MKEKTVRMSVRVWLPCELRVRYKIDELGDVDDAKIIHAEPPHHNTLSPREIHESMTDEDYEELYRLLGAGE